MATNQLDFRVKNGLVVGGAASIGGSAVISVTDNANAALRITQLGTGNALVVEDETNPDASPFVIDSSGFVVVGKQTPIATIHDPQTTTPRTINFQKIGSNSINASIATISYSSSGGDQSFYAPAQYLARSKSDIKGTPGVVADGDILGSIVFSGDDGTNFVSAAQIRSYVDGIPGTNDMPGSLTFHTTADAAGVSTERVRISSTGQTTFSYNAVVSVTDNTNAALRITQLGTGNALIVEDSTNPDASPFVVDAVGAVIVGHTATLGTQNYTGFALTNTQHQIHGAAQSTSTAAIFNWSSSAQSGGNLIFNKSLSNVVGTRGALTAANTDVGVVSFNGDDGTNFIPAASILAETDGIPGVNDMPGRLVFGTTADGALATTERMRIDSAGRLRQFGTTIVSNVDVLNATYDNVFRSVTSQESVPAGVFFSPDGYKMFIVGSNGDEVNEYVLSVAWQVGSASFSALFSLAPQGETSPQGLFFRADGLKMYIAGNTLDGVLQYALTSPWSVTTATYENKLFSVATQETTITSVFFKPDGVSMYATGNVSDGVYQYTLSTPWDVTTATHLQTFSVSGQESASQAVSFTGDGTRMFVMGSTGDDINVYNLTTPWDISTASFVNAFSVAAQETAPAGLYIKPDGTKMYVVGGTGTVALPDDAVYQYSLPSVKIELTGATDVNGSLTVAQDFTVNGNFVGYGSINGMTVTGRSAGDAAGGYTYNTVVGNQSLRKNISGNFNTAIGSEVLVNSTTASNNTAVGHYALTGITTGQNNTAVGHEAGANNTTVEGVTLIGALAGRLNTTGASITALGHYTLYSNTTGANNTGLGRSALQSNTTGANNTAVGRDALILNATASNNTAVGVSALYNTTASNNTAVGYQAAYSNTTGVQLTAVGSEALKLNTGDANTALGSSALAANTTAADNTALGARALYVNTTGSQNTAVGRLALNANTTASNNTAVGYQALTANTTGSSQTAIGFQSMFSATVPADINTAVGRSSLYSLTTGYNNDAFGYASLYSLTTGSNNSAFGREALYSNTADSNTAFGSATAYANTTGVGISAIGRLALRFNTTGSNNTALGQQALYSNTTASQNTAVGYQAGYTNTTGELNTAVGASALRSGSTASKNTAVGFAAAYSTTVPGVNAFGAYALYANTTGNFNSAFGGEASGSYNAALFNNTTGSSNSAFGTPSLTANTTGSQNSAFGSLSLHSNTTGGQNTAFGYGALLSNTASTNTAVGFEASRLTTGGSQNVAVGYQAHRNNVGGNFNVAMGLEALRDANTNNNTALGYATLNVSTGANNTAVGAGAMQVNTTASNNVALGFQAAYNITTASNNTALGYQTIKAGVSVTAGAFVTDTSYTITAVGTTNFTLIGASANTVGVRFTATGVGAGTGTATTNTTGEGNVAVGYQAGNAITTGYNNVVIGKEAFKLATTANTTIAIGNNALATNVKIHNSVAIGANALGVWVGNNNVSEDACIAIGQAALNSATTGSKNTAVGTTSMQYLTTGNGNTALGDRTMQSLTTGSNNTAIGKYAMLGGAVTGGNNVAIGSTGGSGYSTMGSLLSGNSNIGVGNSSLALNTTGGGNIAIGEGTLHNNTAANNNTAVGYQAAYNNGSTITAGAFIVGGSYTILTVGTTSFTAIGASANTVGVVFTATGVGAGTGTATANAPGNVAVGYQAAYSNTAGVQLTAVGESAARSNTIGANNTAIGAVALYSNTTGGSNTAVGNFSQYPSTGSGNTSVGDSSLRFNTSGSFNTAIGVSALFTNTVTSNGTAVGWQAGLSNTTGTVTAIGRSALQGNTTGGGNVAVGQNALLSNTTAFGNTAVGLSAGQNSVAIRNTFLGYQAGFNATGMGNTFIGSDAGQGAASGCTGTHNIAIGPWFDGNQEGPLSAYTSGSGNIAMGYGSLKFVSTGNNNIAIGINSGNALLNGSNNTFVGVSAGRYITSGSDNTIIGNYDGNQGGLDLRASSNYIVLSDGDGNPRAWIGAGNNNDLFRVGSTTTATNSFMHQFLYNQNSRYVMNFGNTTSLGNANGVIIDYPNSAGTTSTDNFLYCGISTGVRALIKNDGGLANFQANNTNISDRREKTNFAPAKSYLDIICAIPVQTFNYIDQDMEDNPGLTLGVVAQDVQEVAPELITESNWGTADNPKMRLSIYQTDLQYALMKALQELKAEFDAYKLTHP